jgi:hypothetical protein
MFWRNLLINNANFFHVVLLHNLFIYFCIIFKINIMKRVLIFSMAFVLVFLSSCIYQTIVDPEDEQVTNLLDEGLVAHYTFDGNANDESGNNRHGVLCGPTLTTDRFGNENSAYLFDGIDDYIDLSLHASSFNIAKPASFSFWVKTRDDFPQAIFSMCNKVSSDSLTSGVFIGDGTTQWLYKELITVANVNTRQNYYIVAFECYDRFWLINDNWHHIVVTYSDITKVYLDNHLLVLSANQTNDGDFGVSGVDYVTLGTRWYLQNGAFLKGSMDDFRFYNRVLTSEEVAELFY